MLGVPGYILGVDMATAKLLAQPPPGASIVSAVADEPDKLKVGTIAPADPHALGGNGWMQIPLRALADGRPRLTLQYSDGTSQVVSYRTLEAFADRIDRHVFFFRQYFVHSSLDKTTIVGCHAPSLSGREARHRYSFRSRQPVLYLRRLC